MPVKLVQRGYSSSIAKRLDPQRPKYSAAVKSIAAFADSIAVEGNRAQVLRVLLTHLDDACDESARAAATRAFRSEPSGT